MILLADSGSTNTAWALLDGQNLIYSFVTKGINPMQQSAEDIRLIIMMASSQLSVRSLNVSEIYFYGAGLISEIQTELIRQIFSETIPHAKVYAYSDMIAAAVAVLGKKSGIAAILGTGSNSCFWNGERIVQQVPPLGYILGDEGSGAVLGKLFVADALKGIFPAEIKASMLDHLQMTYPRLIERIYRQPLANRFLASLAPFIKSYIGNEQVYDLVKGNFITFFQRNICQYDYQNHSLGIIGSIAYHFQDVLKAAAEECGVSLHTVSETPMQGLIHYHQNS